MNQITQHYVMVAVGSFVLLLSGCSREERKLDNQSNSAKVDSISKYIQNGKNLEFEINYRQNQLNKAHNLLSTIENDSLKTKMLSKLSLSYLRLNDSVNFRKSNKETIRLSSNINDSTSLAEANWDLADFYKKFAIADSSFYHYLQAKKIYEKLDDISLMGKMLNNMAIVQAEIKDYTGSEITTIQAIELFKSLRDNTQLYKGYNVLGSVSKELKEYDRSLNYYNTALAYQKKIQKHNSFDLDIKNNIGVVYQELGNYDESIGYFEETLNTKKLFQKDARLYALVLNNLTYSQSKLQPGRDLSEDFKKALQVQDSIGDIAGVSRTHYSFADYYFDKNDTINALIQANKAQHFAKLADNNERVLLTLQLLSKLDPKNSYAYNQRYITLNDSLQEQERQVRNKFARIRFETDEYIAENEMLASEKQLWTGISMAVFLLGASAFVILNQRSKNQKLRFQQEQQAANQEIFNLMLSQTQKEEEGKKSEQKRISEELHDGVLGKMMGARLVLTGLNKKNDSDAEIQRKKAIDVLQDVEKEVRTISHALSHTAYQKINNFILSIQDLLKSVEQAATINCELKYDKEWEWDSLSGEIKINTYRIIQESLQNAVKHAQCKNVTVSFIAQTNSMQIKISDDGSGFRRNKRKKGIGMRNIASRVEKLNGEWHIESSPGKGTTVKLQIPVSFTGNNVKETMKKPELSSQV